ncbi:MAG: hypothetical protein ACI4U5_03145 [Bacilli bacterium]
MVDAIRYVKQQGPFTYGQACIAMLTNQTIEQVIYDLNFDGPYTKSRLKCALDKYGIKYKQRKKRLFRNTTRDYSSFAILIVKCNKYNHMIIYKDGKYFDPEVGILSKEYKRGKIIDFIDIIG